MKTVYANVVGVLIISDTELPGMLPLLMGRESDIIEVLRDTTNIIEVEGKTFLQIPSLQQYILSGGEIKTIEHMKHAYQLTQEWLFNLSVPDTVKKLINQASNRDIRRETARKLIH